MSYTISSCDQHLCWIKLKLKRSHVPIRQIKHGTYRSFDMIVDLSKRGKSTTYKKRPNLNAVLVIAVVIERAYVHKYN